MHGSSSYAYGFLMYSIVNDDCLVALKQFPDDHFESLVTDPPAGISFMGKSWDGDKGGRKQWIAWMTEVMSEVYRVMKPGAHGFVWALPRTSHWTATALEDAGFEVRDCVTHVFGSGFPKSHNISKALDKKAGVEGPIVGENPAYRPNEYTWNQGGGKTPMRPKFKYGSATPQAKQWDGWGTALKPASEHYWLIRKPFKGTVADNVLRHGVGGLNIDASRVEANDQHVLDAAVKRMTGNAPNFGAFQSSSEILPNSSQGRFPSNFMLSHTPHCTDDQCDIECAVKGLDEQSGVTKGTGKPMIGGTPRKTQGHVCTGSPDRTAALMNYGDSGGASRFFYCAKASKRERNEGLGEKINGHPTVKSTKLMQYLITMITPPNGWVLDPFTGSGSTGVAAVKAGFNFQGIEKEQEYAEIAQARIRSISPQA